MLNKRSRLIINSLPGQIILSFLTLILLTALAIGLPAVRVIQNQLERQAWVLVDQGRTTTQAVYEAMQSELENLAILTSQRPTLIALLQQGDQAAAHTYLETFLTGTGLDLVVICGADGKLFTQVGSPLQENLCAHNISSGFYITSQVSPGIACLVGVQPVQTITQQDFKVLVVDILDTETLLAIRQQTNLEQILLIDGQLAATSLPAGQQDWDAWRRSEQIQSTGADQSVKSISTLGGSRHYALRFPLQSRLENVVSLPMLEMASLQKQLTYQLGGGFLLVVLSGTLLAFYLAQRISLPLVKLERSAMALQQGDLSTPVVVETKVSEVAQVAYALEDARSALDYTLAELRQEKAWIEHLLESVVEGIVTLDQRGRITFFSRGAEQISGCLQSEVTGRPCDEIFRPVEENNPFSQLLPLPGKKRNISVAFPSGQQATLAITGAKLAPPEAGHARVALVLRDVSEEHAIHRLLGDYIGNITHEFRTPLAALAASVELLIEQLPDLDPHELATLLNSLRLGVLNLQTLIDNLLEGASIETGRFQVYLRPSDLENILLEVVRLMQPLAEKYRLHLDARFPASLPPVLADPRRTLQVLVNLLDNAIKHSPEGSIIAIEAILDTAAVRVEVADKGPGIPPEMQTALFQRRVRPDINDLQAEHGAGLGLPVAKAIVQAQGGQVGVKNHPEGGAVFWFTLARADKTPSRQELDL